MKWFALILFVLFIAIPVIRRGGEWRRAQGWQTLTAPMYRVREWKLHAGAWTFVASKSVPVGV